MAKLVLALLCAALALVAARQLQQSTVADLPKQLQELNARLAGLVKGSSSANLLEYYKDDDYKYGKEDKYYKEDKYEKKYEDKYEKKYDDKYEKEYEKEYYGKEHEKEYYGYGPKKVTVKLFEKFRSHLRPQPGNLNTFQFTSELTCQNPHVQKDYEHTDGIIGFPIVSDRMKLVTVGVCEWTVTQVKEQRISEHAILKGNTNVVCTFTEEAERHCKPDGEVLEDGLTVSGQGLVYNFDHVDADYNYKAEIKAEAEAPKVKEGEEEADGIDVYLNLINGVVGRNKELKFDNGALQYFFGVPVAVSYEGTGRDGTAAYKKGDPTGEYTFVFKN